MTEEEFKTKQKKGEVTTAKVEAKPPISDFQNDSPEAQARYNLAQYFVFLDAMKFTKKAVSTAPTFVPKNYFDQFQIYENAGTYRLYIYVSAAAGWRYVALT